jgi:hypothetical protein
MSEAKNESALSDQLGPLTETEKAALAAAGLFAACHGEEAWAADGPPMMAMQAIKLPAFRKAIAAAVAAERERCAKLCDEARDAVWLYQEPEVLNAACTVCENLANRIRGIVA